MGAKRSTVDREAVKALLDNRDSGDGEEGFVHGAERVTIELEGNGNGPFRVRKGDFEFVVDEPSERGGQDSAPNPLAYFLGGAATCLLSHYMLCAIDQGMEFDALKVTARGRFNRVLTGGSFQEIIYDVKIDTPHDAAEVAALAERAESMCYAHNTLVEGKVAMTTNVQVNGQLAATLEK